jgi:hypothetical protein
VAQLDKIRDPAALPGWLVTTTQRECERISRSAQVTHAPGHALDAANIPDDQASTAEQVLVAEPHAALRQALAHLPPCCQRLLVLLIEGPPVPYAEISAALGIPVGSIGPTRLRCLDKLRREPVIAALIDAENPNHITTVNIRLGQARHPGASKDRSAGQCAVIRRSSCRRPPSPVPATTGNQPYIYITPLEVNVLNFRGRGGSARIWSPSMTRE